MNKEKTISQLFHPTPGKFFLLAGPCAVEGLKSAYDIATELKRICSELDIPLVFKGSYRKANRSRLDSFTGIGDLKALGILKEISKDMDIPVITDIHESHEAEMAAEFVDVLQIPAFLFRQTDLLVAAAKTGKVVNIKKGQFASSDAMRFAADKVKESGNNKILLTERGNTFGYGDLIVDMRNIPRLKKIGYPVVMDVTHSLQQPNSASGVTGGLPELIDTIARSAIAAGADGVFLETHPNPEKAKSDGANMLKLDRVKPLLESLLKIKSVLQ
ncbi:MAG: 3-deoxy-8-phosphooctulonate synthase [Flavobacteriales bacterium]|nr:3-deoxy-8-phosphooctulonate synthase [Flavobacteriales bacterium]